MTTEVVDTDITKLEVDAIANAAIERVVFAVRGSEAREVFEAALTS